MSARNDESDSNDNDSMNDNGGEKQERKNKKKKRGDSGDDAKKKARTSNPAPLVEKKLKASKSRTKEETNSDQTLDSSSNECSQSNFSSADAHFMSIQEDTKRGGIHGVRGYCAQLLYAVQQWLTLPDNSNGFIGLENAEDCETYYSYLADDGNVKYLGVLLAQYKDHTGNLKVSDLTFSSKDVKPYFLKCLDFILDRKIKKDNRPFIYMVATTALKSIERKASRQANVLYAEEWDEVRNIQRPTKDERFRNLMMKLAAIFPDRKKDILENINDLLHSFKISFQESDIETRKDECIKMIEQRLPKHVDQKNAANDILDILCQRVLWKSLILNKEQRKLNQIDCKHEIDKYLKVRKLNENQMRLRDRIKLAQTILLSSETGCDGSTVDGMISFCLSRLGEILGGTSLQESMRNMLEGIKDYGEKYKRLSPSQVLTIQRCYNIHREYEKKKNAEYEGDEEVEDNDDDAIAVKGENFNCEGSDKWPDYIEAQFAQTV